MDKENKYGDIIEMPHHTSVKHPRMSAIARAAQFSPFAALSGHSAALQETARLTDRRIELDEIEKSVINKKLRMLSDLIGKSPEVDITCFEPDEKKSGGAYITVTSRIKKIDSYKREIIMIDGRRIAAENIYDIQGKIFGNTEF